MSSLLKDMHVNKTPSPERSYKHSKSPWTADRLKKKTKTSPAWKGLPDVIETEESDDSLILRSSINFSILQRSPPFTVTHSAVLWFDQ